MHCTLFLIFTLLRRVDLDVDQHWTQTRHARRSAILAHSYRSRSKSRAVPPLTRDSGSRMAVRTRKKVVSRRPPPQGVSCINLKGQCVRDFMRLDVEHHTLRARSRKRLFLQRERNSNTHAVVVVVVRTLQRNSGVQVHPCTRSPVPFRREMERRPVQHQSHRLGSSVSVSLRNGNPPTIQHYALCDHECSKQQANQRAKQA